MITTIKPVPRLSAQFERKAKNRIRGDSKSFISEIGGGSENSQTIAEKQNKPAWRGHHMDIWV